jgi:hypothetical protein
MPFMQSICALPVASQQRVSLQGKQCFALSDLLSPEAHAHLNYGYLFGCKNRDVVTELLFVRSAESYMDTRPFPGYS